MNLSKDMQKRFTDEIRFVIDSMEGSDNPREKLYFLSAVYGMAQRIINFEFNPELCFVNQVLVLVYNLINARLGAISVGQEGAVSIPDKLFTRLEEALKEMADRVERREETYPPLQKMVNLAYSTTGNGYYLYLKGMLTV